MREPSRHSSSFIEDLNCNILVIATKFGLITVIFLSLFAQNTALGADIIAGKAIYQRACVSCHGASALGNDALGSPALAGQLSSYLQRQLEHFSNGVRGSDPSDTYGKQMSAMSALVADAQSKADVSAYLASLKIPTESSDENQKNQGNELGYKVYQASCGACHGAQGRGNSQLNSPSLANLSKPYLARQYTNFLNGKRGNHASDKYGRQMKMIAATVTEQEKIDAVIAYIASLSNRD